MKNIYSKKTLLFTCFLVGLLFSTKQAKAQQDAQYTMYMYNGLALNPAYAGSRDRISATGLFRTQWVGIDGAPQTQSFFIHAPLFNQKMGAGLVVVNDKLGVNQTTEVRGAYSFRINMNKSTLAFGIQGGLTRYEASLNDVQHSISNNILDPAFNEQFVDFLPNFGVGAFFNTQKFYIGLSVPQLLNNDITNGISDARQSVHYFLTSGYVFDLSPTIKLKPSFLFKYVQGTPWSIDINANLNFFDRFGAGISYRVDDSIDFIFDWAITQDLTIAYAFDYTLTDLGEYNSGSHEIMLRYEFSLGGKNKGTKIITPRHF